MGTALVIRRIGNFPIGQRVTDGYINATILSKACGKEWSYYWRLKGTQEFIDELESDLGIPRSLLVQTVKGVTLGSTPKDQGTWIHPDMAVNLALMLERQFRIALPVELLEEATTVGQMAAWIERKIAAP